MTTNPLSICTRRTSMASSHSSSQASTPLADTTLSVQITDLVAEHCVSHRFENAGKEPIEAVYSFPIPLDAAFLGMRATLAGETVDAVIQPMHQAEQEYDDAIADGHSAVLRSNPQPGLLCVVLSNLLPGENGIIELRFATRLSVADQRARFSLPLVHRPRYGHWRLDEMETPEHDFAVEHPMSASIKVSGLLAQAAVTSRSHPVQFKQLNDALMLEIGQAMLDRDLVLDFDLSTPLPATCHLIDDGDANLALATFVLPPAEQAAQSLDLCLVLDCSGSMSGDAITQSRKATAAIVASLNPDDRIQILRFGSSILPIFRRPLRATARVCQAVDVLLPSVNSDLGGTEMGDALERALADLGSVEDRAEHQPRSRVVVLVTDGAVQAEDIASAQASALEAGVRIFIVAVGSSAGAEVLQPLAEATGAVMERAVPGESIDAGVMRQFRRARLKAPITLKAIWPDDQAETIDMGVTYPGDAASVAAHLSLAACGDVTIKSSNGHFALTLALGERSTHPALRALVGQQRYRANDATQRETLALHYGLLTAETSAVLVKQRSEAEKGAALPRIAPVPQMVPSGMVTNAHVSLSMGSTSAAYRVSGCISAACFDMPSFSRRQPETEEPVLVRDELHVELDPVPAAEATAILEALYAVLLEVVCDSPSGSMDLESIIRALPDALQLQARDLLSARGPTHTLLHDGYYALLLQILGDMLSMPTMNDEQEAALAVATSKDPGQQNVDLPMWKERIANEWDERTG